MSAVMQVKTWTPDDLAQLEDCELAAHCLDGNSAAWEALLHRYKRLIYSIPVKAKMSPADAEDVFQDVCLKLYEKLSTLRDHQRIAPWLITTTSRQCWRVSVRNRREVTSGKDEDEGMDYLSEIADQGPLADKQHETMERQQALREAIETLPERSRKLIHLLFYEVDEMSYAEIARWMNMPVASIGPTRARCLERLRKIMDEKLNAQPAGSCGSSRRTRKPRFEVLAAK